MAPALQRFNTAFEIMKDHARGSIGDRSRLRSLLVTAEFALAVVLLISASLLIQSFRKLQEVPPGFNAENVLTARIWMPQPNIPSTGPYFDHPSRVSLFRRSLEKIRALPGVADAGWVRRLPLTGQRGTSAFLVEGRPIESADASTVEPGLADGGYFRAMQIPLLRGRLFTDEDDEKHPPVLIISESFVKVFFGNEDPLGMRIRPGGRNSTAPWMTVVGVVGDVKTGALETDSLPQMYRSAYQTSSLDMALVVRTQVPPGSLTVPLRRAIREFDPNLPLFNVQPMPDLMSGTLAQRKFSMRLLGLFALLALALSVVGVYGVMAYTVQQRTAEIGIRVALGAARVDVLKMVLQRGLVLTGTGVLLGVGGSLGLTRYLSGLLFGMSPFDPLTYVTTSVALTAVALFACFVPARRAMHVDPMIALRHE
jgi:predicted permease